MAKKKKVKHNDCDCMDQVNELLKEKGLVIRTETLISLKTCRTKKSNPIIKLDRLEGSKKPMFTLFCSYCPFCGKKYPS